MGIRTRADFLDAETAVDPHFLVPASRMVQDFAGMHVQPNKAIVGLNAFRHQSGIHQDGVVKLRETYEIMDPKEVGWKEGSQFVLSKLSGRAGFRARLDDLGYQLEDEEFNRAFLRFQELADRKNTVDDRDLEAIVADNIGQAEEAWRIESIHVTTGTGATPTASIKLRGPDGGFHEAAETGTGPVDAVYKTIRGIIGTEDVLTEYAVTAITEGIDAQGEVTIRIEIDEVTYTGRGVGPGHSRGERAGVRERRQPVPHGQGRGAGVGRAAPDAVGPGPVAERSDGPSPFDRLRMDGLEDPASVRFLRLRPSTLRLRPSTGSGEPEDASPPFDKLRTGLPPLHRSFLWTVCGRAPGAMERGDRREGEGRVRRQALRLRPSTLRLRPGQAPLRTNGESWSPVRFLRLRSRTNGPGERTNEPGSGRRDPMSLAR